MGYGSYNITYLPIQGLLSTNQVHGCVDQSQCMLLHSLKEYCYDTYNIVMGDLANLIIALSPLVDFPFHLYYSNYIIISPFALFSFNVSIPALFQLV